MASAAPASPLAGLRSLADPQRWRLLEELGRSDRTVGELTELIGKPQNLVSYHLAGLRDVGLVSARRSSADGRDTYYRAETARYAELLCAAGSALQPGLRLTEGRERPSGGRTGRKPSVLFLCTGNSTRSQMAEAFLEHLSAGAVDARSAGSHPKPLHPNAVRVMSERGIDIAGQKTKPMRIFGRSRFDRVITLCDKVREICPEFPDEPTYAHWSMADPASDGAPDASTYREFVRTADELEGRITLLINELTRSTEGRRQR